MHFSNAIICFRLLFLQCIVQTKWTHRWTFNNKNNYFPSLLQMILSWHGNTKTSLKTYLICWPGTTCFNLLSSKKAGPYLIRVESRKPALKLLEDIPLPFYHWAIKVGNIWYEIVGKGTEGAEKGIKNDIQRSEGYAAASTAGFYGGQCGYLYIIIHIENSYMYLS